MNVEKAQRAEVIRSALPEGGLFHEKSWRVSPDAFVIGRKFAEELEKLGYRLLRFVRACNQLYRFSVSGRQPTWIAELLDCGKPGELACISPGQSPSHILSAIRARRNVGPVRPSD